MPAAQCHIDKPTWDGRTCPPCQGTGRVWDLALVTGAHFRARCPWCGGDGKSGQERAALAALNKLWSD